MSLAQAITDDLRRRIVSGDLRQGHRLPSLRRLAAMYQVSVPTVASAIHALTALGFVRVSRGVGLYVRKAREDTALLTYAWRSASIQELAVVRGAIDERAAALLAARVSRLVPLRVPRAVADVSFFAQERSMQRHGIPEWFLKADIAFHRTVLAGLRGIEIGPAVYDQVTGRLIPALMGVADVQAVDVDLDRAHIALATTILEGDIRATARLARTIAITEQRSLVAVLG